MIVIQTGTTMREMNGVAQLISSAVQASGVDDTISKQLTETLQKSLMTTLVSRVLKISSKYYIALRKIILNLLSLTKKK
jgi:hypothetical protein